MSDAFTPTSKPPSVKSAPTKPVVDEFVPPLTSLTNPDDVGKEDPDNQKENQVLGEAPSPKMAPIGSEDQLLTDITMQEIAAGKQAAAQYERRRQAEFTYGKTFVAKRNERIK